MEIVDEWIWHCLALSYTSPCSCPRPWYYHTAHPCLPLSLLTVVACKILSKIQTSLLFPGNISDICDDQDHQECVAADSIETGRHLRCLKCSIVYCSKSCKNGHFMTVIIQHQAGTVPSSCLLSKCLQLLPLLFIVSCLTFNAALLKMISAIKINFEGKILFR